MNVPWIILEVVGIVLAWALATELLAWLLIWRPESYKKMIVEAEAIYKRLEPAMRYRGEEKDKKKAAAKPDTAFLKISSQMMRIKMYSAVLSVLPMILQYRQISALYKGRVAAQLPFTPIPLFYGMTHSGIEGTDFTVCSAMFIYYLAGMGIRGNVSKLFNFGPPRHLSDFFGPTKAAEEVEKMKKKTN